MKVLIATQLLSTQKGKKYTDPVYQMIEEDERIRFAQFLANATQTEVRLTTPHDKSHDVAAYSALYLHPGNEVRDISQKSDLSNNSL